MSAYITPEQKALPAPRKTHGGASLEDYQAAAKESFEKEQEKNTVRATDGG